METVFALIVGAAIAAVVTWWVVRANEAGARVALETERNLLRERIADLEVSIAEDAQTASLLAPLREALTRVEGQVGTLERDRVKQFGSISTVLEHVQTNTNELGKQTQSLVGALQSSTTRGAWGEVQLRRVLEVSGMLPHCDFEEQVSATTSDARQVRPDVVVRLPGEKTLVIDSKAPMTAFLDSQADGVEPERRAKLLADHARAVKGHVDRLSTKEYWEAFPNSPEMVVCFIPSDAMLAAALEADPGMHVVAMAKRVVLVGPAALMALLRTVAFTWRQDALSTSAKELLGLGTELYHRLSTLGDHTAKMGRSLHSTIEAYNAMVGTLESRVLVTARRMNDLGLTTDILDTVPTVETGPRPLAAMELIDAVIESDARQELPFERRGDSSTGPTRHAS